MISVCCGKRQNAELPELRLQIYRTNNSNPNFAPPHYYNMRKNLATLLRHFLYLAEIPIFTFAVSEKYFYLCRAFKMHHHIT